MKLTQKTLLGGVAIASSALVAMLLAAAPTSADPNDNELVVEGETFVTKLKAPEGSPFEDLYSGWRFRDPATQVIQTDDFTNPGMLVVERGEAEWSKVDGTAGKSCASCHNDASQTMKGVRAQMPKWQQAAAKPLTLEQTINACRTTNMGAAEWKWESDEMLGMTAYIGLQSRGMPVNVKTDGEMSLWLEKGKEIYYARNGQLDMSCATCHEQNTGKMIRADHLSQGHVNGFPTYRLKWGGVGSIHRRFKGCMQDVRAEPYAVGSDEFVALELYVASRGMGLSVETPSVRQ